MNNVMRTPEDLQKFFELLQCRVKITEIDDVEPFPKLIIRVPRDKYHFVRWHLSQTMPMGLLYELENLGFFECRIKKYQYSFRRFQ